MRFQRTVAYPAIDLAELLRFRRRRRIGLAAAGAMTVLLLLNQLRSTEDARVLTAETQSQREIPDVRSDPDKPMLPRLQRGDVSRLPFEPRVPAPIETASSPPQPEWRQ